VSEAASWLIFPAVYLVYSLVRGPIADWYPYPFLDPDHGDGYANVALTSAAVLVTIIVLAALLRLRDGPTRVA
jgi:hypothetical protein